MRNDRTLFGRVFGFSWKRFSSVLSARNKEFLRDRSALGWNFLFPFLVVLGFGYGFGSEDQELFKVAVVGKPDPALVSTSSSVQK